MAGNTEFAYKSIQLYKSESLGSGSYGGVCKAKCDGLLCAAKIIHPTLFDQQDPGADSYIKKFQEECHLLSLARHPNVVQYLATYYDPDTQLPVLLMELCDESLTAFLEQSPGPLSFNTQINICHDITLALIYLHSNGLIHRDLTGNNVLMIAGTRAKVTDFGMSKLANVNPRMTALTLCPGNVLYMSPEALDETQSYTDKLDIFSFGVIIIQILTRQLPNPTDRFRTLHVAQVEEEVRVLVPEVERRRDHLDMIPETHPLKPLSLQCLKKKESDRPSALHLSERLSELKRSSHYRSSMSQQNRSIERLVENERLTKKEMTDREHELQQTQAQLQASKQLASQLQESLLQNEKTINDLKESVPQWGEPDMISSGDTQCMEPDTSQQITEAQETTQMDISKMRWREGKNAPEIMARGVVVAYKNMAYIRPSNSNKIYSYTIQYNLPVEEQWCRLLDAPNGLCGLVVIDGLLTCVCGFNDSYINTLLSLTDGGKRMQWCEVFPPMPTPRGSAACITTDKALIVAGGYADNIFLDTVEVMMINTKQWITVCPLPQKMLHASIIVCGDLLYLGGSIINTNSPSKSVFTCLIPDLLPSNNTLGSRLRRTLSWTQESRQNVWREISSLPVIHSTLVSFGSHVLAIGGKNDSEDPTADVYRYDSDIDTWSVVCQTNSRQSLCFAFTFSKDCLVVIGGYTNGNNATNSVTILK